MARWLANVRAGLGLGLGLMLLALVVVAACGRKIELPVEPESGGLGNVAYLRKYIWEGMPPLRDLVLTVRRQALYGIDPAAGVRCWFSDYASAREQQGRELPPDPVALMDTLREPVQLCEGRNGTLWVAYARPRPTLLQWNIEVVPPVPIDSGVVRDNAFRELGGIAADPDSEFVYVSDSFANTITKHSPSATGGRRITTLAAPGNGDTFVQQPHGLFAFGDSLLVADTGKNWLQVISSRAPQSGRGQVKGTTDEPLLLNEPFDVWMDPSRFFYVSDRGNSRVLKVTREGLIKEIVTELDQHAAARPGAIAANDTRVWVVDPDSSRLTIYQINTTSEDLP
jgi:hypothetical protein